MLYPIGDPRCASVQEARRGEPSLVSARLKSAAEPAINGGQTPEPGAPAIVDFDRDLDTRGLNCPLPVLRTKKALAEMASGQVLRIVATDPGSVKDFQAFSKQTGNSLLSHAEAGKEFVFFMRKK